MRFKSILFTVCLCNVVFQNCKESSFTNDYDETPNISILDIKEELLEGTVYNHRYDENIEIKILLKDNNNIIKNDNVIINWKLGDRIITTGNKLSLPNIHIDAGKHNILVEVYDTINKRYHYSKIVLNLWRGISRGTYILTTNELKATSLFMISEDSKEVIRQKNKFNEILLGENPIELIVNSNSSEKSEYTKMLIVTSKGEYPIFSLDYMSLSPSFKIPAIGSVIDNTKLEPHAFIAYEGRQHEKDNFDGLIQINGKAYQMVNKTISGDVFRNDPLNYDFSDSPLVYSTTFGKAYLAGFDNRSERIRIFGAYPSFSGIYNTDCEISWNHSITKGYQTKAIISTYYQGFIAYFYIITNQSDAYTVVLIYSSNTKFTPYVISMNNSTALVNGNNFKNYNNHLYFSHKRSIYRTNPETLEMETVLSLPEDNSGDIVAWNFNNDIQNGLNRIGVATYNKLSNNKFKGSYYLFNSLNKKFEKNNLFIIDKAKDLEICY